MPRLGAHMSVAGGLPRAVERAVVHHCDAIQIFAKNANQWRGRPILREEVREFRARIKAARIHPVVSHASYLINLATTSRVLRQQSLDAMGDEIDRAEALGLLGVVLHPGCYTAGSEAEGLTLIADGLLELLRVRRRGRTMVLLEHTAGQGTSLGSTFEQLASIIAKMNDHRRIGVCLDSCHLLAAGYDLCSPEGYASTFQQFGRLVGFDRLKVFHLNDSKRPLGSRVDRHEHIGEGFLGLEPFRRIVNDRRFRGLPMLLETPKEQGRSPSKIEVDRFDQRNLDLLRGLLRSARYSPRGTSKLLRSPLRRARARIIPSTPVPSRTSVVGSGTFAAPVDSVRILSSANAGAAALLKVIWTRSNTSVLWMPAKPPVNVGSITPLYDSDPSGVAPWNSEMVVAFATGMVFRIAYPYPNVSTNPGRSNVSTPALFPTDTIFGGVMLLVTPGPPSMTTWPLPKL
jgi:deoxyribonuclease-4